MRRPVLVALVCLLSAFSAAANNIQVEVTQDVLAIDQVCTLREAIISPTTMRRPGPTVPRAAASTRSRFFSPAR